MPLNKNDHAEMRELAKLLLKARKPEDRSTIYDSMLEILEQKPAKVHILIRRGDTKAQVKRRFAKLYKRYASKDLVK